MTPAPCPHPSRAVSRRSIATLLALSLGSCGKGAPDDAGVTDDQARPRVTVVKADAQAAPPTRLAVHACAGLYNGSKRGAVYVESEARDAAWREEFAWAVDETIDEGAFLARCVADFSVCVRYSYAGQRTLLPSILTAAAALGAVPVDETMPLACGSVALDAAQTFADKATPLLATRHVFEQFGKLTTGLAMLNPGYDNGTESSSSPPLTSDMEPALVDLVFARKLFVAYLVNGCIEGHPERALLSDVVNAGYWPTPLGVYGYNSTWNVLGGYLYEAQTRCLDSRNMGAIPSRTSNLSFFGLSKPITEPNVVAQNPPEDVAYDPDETFVAFVVGDGDNIEYLTGARRAWFRQRLEACARGDGCPTLTWTLSPHLPTLAPELLRWYYDRSHDTGHDYFALPPSGHLYAYPSSLAEADQARFAEATERDARILGVTGVVHWDWFGTWHDAEDLYLPRYAAAQGPIRGVFPVNVPYKFHAFPWWPSERFHETLTGGDGGRVVVFRPRSWRGVDDDADPFFVSPQKMADELASYPKGTVAWVYMTSDGGLTLENSFLPMAKLLPPHVRLVSADAAARLALASGAK
jgi:hypothetical protein